MTGLCFVDANVLVYVRDARDPVKQARAKAWHEHLWREQTGRTSMQVISELYVNLLRLRGAGEGPAELWERVARYFAWTPHPIDEALLRRAHEIEQRYRLSWWDSMIVAAAQLQECTLLLTEDLHDGAAFGMVVVRSPFTLEVSEPAAVYAARPLVASLHRPRGRPRRAVA
jgi:predicted nucleic acid-binding protein